MAVLVTEEKLVIDKEYSIDVKYLAKVKSTCEYDWLYPDYQNYTGYTFFASGTYKLKVQQTSSSQLTLSYKFISNNDMPSAIRTQARNNTHQLRVCHVAPDDNTYGVEDYIVGEVLLDLPNTTDRTITFDCKKGITVLDFRARLELEYSNPDLEQYGCKAITTYNGVEYVSSNYDAFYLKLTDLPEGSSLTANVVVTGNTKQSTVGNVFIDGVWKDISEAYVQKDGIWTSTI